MRTDICDQAADRAARAIVELINARPTSPRHDEIVGIIKALALQRPAAACQAHALAGDGLDQYGPDLTKL